MARRARERRRGEGESVLENGTTADKALRQQGPWHIPETERRPGWLEEENWRGRQRPGHQVVRNLNPSLKENTEVFGKRVTRTDLHFKKNYPGYSCDKEVGGEGRARDGGELTEGLLPSSSWKGRRPGPGWWAGQPEGEALNAAPERGDRLLDFGGAHGWAMRRHNVERGLHEEAHSGPASCSSKCLDSHFLFA